MKVIICGSNGRMGRMVVETAEEYKDVKIIGGVDTCNESEHKFPVFSCVSEISVKPDVIIDFSNPKALSPLLEYGRNNKVPIVICTTGFSKDQTEQIRKVSSDIPVFFSGNMSIGINLLIAIAKKTAETLGSDFDIEIVEKHHSQKIDAPSGTAFMIADEISRNRNNSMQYVYDRHSQRKTRDKHEIGIHSIRGGNIIGDHDVIFAGNNEVITLSHHAQSRKVFAEGAIKAARFIKDKPNGMYNMKDLTN